MSRQVFSIGVGAWLWTALAVTAAAQAPNIVLDPPHWNFGSVTFGAPLRQTVTLKNTGDAPLRIGEVKSSCGCTAQNLSPHQTIPAGGSTEFTVNYDSTKGRQRVSQTIRIYSSDPDTPVYAFSVQGECKPLFAFGPRNLAAINFGTLDPDKSQTSSITLTVLDANNPIKLSLQRTDVPPYTLALKTIKPGLEYEVTATTKPPLRDGSQTRLFYLETDIDVPKRFKLRINGYVPAPARLLPPMLWISPQLAQPTVRDVVLTYQPDTPVKITKIECDDKRVSWQFPAPGTAQNVPNGQLVKVTVPAGQDIPARGIMMKFHTDSKDPQYKVLNLAIRQQPTRAARPVRPAPPAQAATAAPQPASVKEQ